MVAKCVNPFCNHPFRYLGRGKLFVTEYPPTLASGINLRQSNREHFWLCEECARIATVAIRREHGGVTIRIVNLPPNGVRKLDFVPGSLPVGTPPGVNKRKLPEFSFESL